MPQVELSVPARLDELLTTVALETGLSLDQLKSKSRRARFIRGRSFFALRAREAGHSLIDIGEALNRSHCAVMNYLKKEKAKTAESELPPIPEQPEGVKSMAKEKTMDEKIKDLSPDERRDLVAILSKTAASKEERAALAALFREQDSGGGAPDVEAEPAQATPAKKRSFLDDL